MNISITAPDFKTTLLRESLGYIPGSADPKCLTHDKIR
jgi:hypothetical protein